MDVLTALLNGVVEEVIKRFDMKDCKPAIKSVRGSNYPCINLKYILDEEDEKRYQAVTSIIIQMPTRE